MHVIYSANKNFSIARIIFKAPICYVSAQNIFLIILVSLWTIYNIPDRPLNPEVEKFFYKNSYSLDNNVRVAWAGLYAPAGTKDIYSYGLKIYNEEIDNTKHLEFKGNIDDISPPQTNEIKSLYNDNISPPQTNEIKSLYIDNKELIDRYVSLYSYENFGDDNTIGGHIFGQDLITIHQFLPLYWEELAKNHQGVKAIKWWLKDMKFIQEMMGSRSNLVEKAIWMVQYNLTLKALTPILQADPSLITIYKDQIIALISKDFISDIWNVEETWRAEYNALRDLQIEKLPHNLLIIKPNDTRNRFLELTKDMIKLSTLPFQDMDDGIKRIKDKYICSQWYCYSYNIAMEFIIDNFVKGGEMYKNAYVYSANQNTLILWIEAKSMGLTSKDMPKFLADSPQNLYNPLNNKPFSWDNMNESIYFLSDETDPNSRKDTPYDNSGFMCHLDEKYWFNSENVINNDPLISLCITDPIPLKDILSEISRQSNYKYIIDENITDTIKFAAKNIPIKTLIYELCNRAKLNCKIENKILTVTK